MSGRRHIVGERGLPLVDIDRDGKFARDTFLLAKLLPTTDSPKLCAMIYDAVVADLGQPGAGYDPVALFYAGRRHSGALHPLLAQAEKDGIAAARAAGWY